MGRADKREALLAGALRVFGRDGYSRASIDAIAAEAGVSTRTIYNHFADKAELFGAVIQSSAERVAAAQISVIDAYLRKVTDVESDLVDFGLAFAGSTVEFADHFALVRQINAETGHLPEPAIAAWQAAGPIRVRRALTERVAALVERGLVRTDDPARAALHLMVLISVANPSYHAEAQTPQDVRTMVETGVAAFLHGYQS